MAWFLHNKVMKTIKIKIFSVSIIAFSLILMSAGWKTDFAKAKEEAKQSNKYILLSFSGSDWCVPCIKTKKEIFEKEAFTKFAGANLVLVNADFPRLKKNSISKEQSTENDVLAEQYDKEGVFPYILLLTADGKVIKEWRGYPGVTPEVFVSEIKEFEHAN